MQTPTWALTLAYWVHMQATVVWIGGLAILSIVVIPAARKALDDNPYAALLDALQRKLDPLAWFSAALLLGSGMLQMSASPHYDGFLAINSSWAGAMLIKHLVFGLMVAFSAAFTWGILPALRRAAIKQARGRSTPEMGQLRRRERLLLQVNLVLGVIVLALTAFARAV
ncbi:MAG: hypothetical protein HN413_07115 [Chloroflexi bacterium]|jgi:uncharacterized membrane protein|nr:hypothetical protein [Chloroflexota bacterium]